jgi:hypothetical protein
MKQLFTSLFLLCLFTLTACRSTGYAVKEQFGIEKRDILVGDVEAARDSQEAAKEQFASALEQFQSVVDVEGGDLEKKYNKLSKEYDKSEARANAVSKRINDVEQVSRDLFKEWKQELKQYQSPELRRSSEEQLRLTQNQFESMLSTMRDAEAKMSPVLAAFRDQVLFLKHNLNSRAIASIQTEAANVTRQIEQLIQDMNASIDEANAFIKSMEN